MRELKTERYSLAPGEALVLGVGWGDLLLVARGRVMLRTPPEWLADHLLAPVMVLAAEECHRVAVAGRAEIVAREVTELVFVAAVRGGWRSWWRRWCPWPGRESGASGKTVAGVGLE